MPSTNICVALNTAQNKKAPLLLPDNAPLDPSAKESCYERVIKVAQSKLRLKKGNYRVFLGRSGNAVKKEAILLVSLGEEYIGNRKHGNGHAEANASCSIQTLFNTAPVDNTAITQLETTARTLSGLIHAVGQPDLHPGTKFPIGAVFVSRGWIHPPLIGGDIGCGMSWYRTKLPRSSVDGDKGKKVAEKLRGLEGVWRSAEDRVNWLGAPADGKCYSAGEEWDKSLGTIGAGNHFAEIQVVEDSTREELEPTIGMKRDQVVLLVHSGSRGYGQNIVRRYASDTDPSLQEDDPKAKEYLREHDNACERAKANRDLIALRFLAILEPGEEAWEPGVNATDTDKPSLSGDALVLARAQLNERKVVDIWHNNIERIKWPPAPPYESTTVASLSSTLSSVSLKNQEEAETDKLQPQAPQEQYHVYIHCKGAAPTYDPQTATPLSLLPLPGSRATPTLIIRPSFSDSTAWGAKNALSLAHGAGRSMSRAKALQSLGSKYPDPTALLEPTAASRQERKKGEGGEDVNGGTWVICDEKSLVWEEAREAYKDVYDVFRDLKEEGVAECVGWCRARVSYKVRDEGR
ncbi:hypothetical protein K402DRAFT_414694 [Aulographum hederae CBS 113979]|uniref:3'-phosphate/5'-hydroxy nucleic acid ligase n=1 Tax=Aulographum hederae CBS 113979 TaxID=1176131 RepID=A0A6G1GPS5_9PEZI|nr:hypothetical protein K402DRAFT_414694 [Aulographum hederae CBS 113979]